MSHVTSVQAMTNPLHDSEKSQSKLEKIGVELQLREFAISIEQKSPFSKIFPSDKDPVKSFFIVHTFSTIIPASSLFAILGGSGSGKTTLLNVLAGRYDRNSYKVHGTVRLSQPDCNMGYVTQSDFLLPHLTVRETLTFTAKLKISPENLTKLLGSIEGEEPVISYERLVETVIMDLGLKECADSQIGVDALVDGKRGISGGEKRRVSVGLQILTDPEVLCADEPTSGLDSFTAITLMESLKRLTKQNRKTTVICSIHQPRADVFNIFDSVLVLSKGGNAIYCGPTKDMLQYFLKIGYECPSNANPADYFVDLSSIDLEDSPNRKESIARVQGLIKHFKDENLDIADSWKSYGNSDDDLKSRQPSEPSFQAGYIKQYVYLVNRFMLNNLRDSADFYGGIIQSLILSVIIMAIFWQLGDSQADVQSRSGLIYITISMEPYIALLIFISRYFSEIRVLDRELQDNLYHPAIYLLAHTTSMVPQLTIQSFLYSIPIYFGCNMRPGINYFLMFAAVNIVLLYIINGLCWFCLSVNRIFSVVQLFSNFSYTFITLSAGFLVNLNTFPVYMQWLQNISFLSYAYRIMMSNEFTNREFCDSYCISGNEVLSSDGITENDFITTWPAILAIGLAYYLLAAVDLTYLRFPPNGSVSIDVITSTTEDENILGDGSSSKASESDRSESEKRSMKSIGGSNVREVTISVRKVNLYVELTGHQKKVFNDQKKKILKNINVELKPGKLIALMGGSGSGKTTLLNLIANRIPHSSLRRSVSDYFEQKKKNPVFSYFTSDSNNYFGEGEVLFNGKRPTSKDVRYSIGYVPQFDYHLPSLTVVETLNYQARLRLPLGTEEGTFQQRVTEVLRTLGLVQCMNVQVGNEEKKGISGGEKRRLSIGIQLLSDPSICLFDEPTTGLDAFTARHIVQTLKSLAVVNPYGEGEGLGLSMSGCRKRTVVLSIHQPRYDIFACIDEVTLLSRGDIVWSGTVEDMLKHFSNLGFPCPSLVNPADFILDLSSLDFRSSEREVSTRSTLALLVKGYHERRTADHIELAETTRVTDQSTNPMISESGVAQEGLQVSSANDEFSPQESMKALVSLSKPDYVSFPILLRRSLTNLLRQPQLFATRVYQPLFFGLILAAYYAPVGNDQNSVQNRIGNLYELTATCFIGMLDCIDIFPVERNVFYREYVDGIYSSRAFIVAYFVISIPVIGLGSFLLSLLMNYGVGLAPSMDAVFEFTYCLFSFMFVGECLGVIFCSVFSHVGFSLNIVSAVISVFGILAGFISVSPPQFLEDISNISPLYWGAYLMSNIVFEGQTFTCNEDDELPDGSCYFQTGDQVLDLYNFGGRDGKYGMTYHYWMLGIVTTIYFLIAIVGVRLRAYKISH